jgi:uncharacterized protein YlaI
MSVKATNTVYVEYLKTEHWQKQRQEAIEFWGKRCMICDSQEALNVHHRTYKSLGNESILDLVVLCSDCHALFHNKLKSDTEDIASVADMLWTMNITRNTGDLHDYVMARNRWGTMCLSCEEYETGIKQIADWIGV